MKGYGLRQYRISEFAITCGLDNAKVCDWLEKKDITTFEIGQLVTKEDAVIRNYLIAYASTSKKRREFAIWRLYRYYDEPVNYIAHGLHTREIQVRQIIGKVFKYLCLTDKECIFKPLFSEVRKD